MTDWGSFLARTLAAETACEAALRWFQRMSYSPGPDKAGKVVRKLQDVVDAKQKRVYQIPPLKSRRDK